MSTLGTRIMLGTIASTGVVVLIASIGVWMAARTILYRSFDDKLLDRAHGTASRGLPMQMLTHARREGEPPEPTSSGMLMQVLREDTREEVYRSVNLAPELSLAALVCEPFDGRLEHARLADGKPVSVVAVNAAGRSWGRRPPPPQDAKDVPQPPPPGAEPAGPVNPALNGPFVVILAANASGIHDDLDRLALVLLALWGGAVALSAVVSAWLRRAVLRPVDRLSQAILAMDASNLSARISMQRVPDEMVVVLDRLNTLFGRVEAAFKREKATIANIAHELRTPIAGLRTTLEFSLVRDGDAAAKQVQTKCLGVVVQMQDMISNLLALARLESGEEAWKPVPVEIASLAKACWEPFEDRARTRHISARWNIAQVPAIPSSPDKLRVILSNLFDNAVSHAVEVAVIDIEISATPEGVVLRVANPTSGPVDTASVFQPFWRGDSARSGGMHCGLGLSLVQRLARLLGGTVEASIDHQSRFVITVQLPLLSASLPALARG